MAPLQGVLVASGPPVDEALGGVRRRDAGVGAEARRWATLD